MYKLYCPLVSHHRDHRINSTVISRHQDHCMHYRNPKFFLIHFISSIPMKSFQISHLKLPATFPGNLPPICCHSGVGRREARFLKNVFWSRLEEAVEKEAQFSQGGRWGRMCPGSGTELELEQWGRGKGVPQPLPLPPLRGPRAKRSVSS